MERQDREGKEIKMDENTGLLSMDIMGPGASMTGIGYFDEKGVGIETSLLKSPGMGGVAIGATEEKDYQERMAGARLNEVIVDLGPVISFKDRMRVFEIATKVGDWSRATEVDKNTGHEYWDSKTLLSACNGTTVEDVERYIVLEEIKRNFYEECMEAFR